MFAGLIIYLLLFTASHTPTPHVLGTSHSVVKISPTKAPIPTLTATPTPTNTPTPTPIPPTATPIPTYTPVPLPPSSYESYFDQYANQYGVNKDLMKRIATCESGMNPGSNGGIYGGMFQFDTQTWISTRTRMGLDTNPDLRYNAEEAIKSAAFKISQDGTRAWSGCL